MLVSLESAERLFPGTVAFRLGKKDSDLPRTWQCGKNTARWHRIDHWQWQLHPSLCTVRCGSPRMESSLALASSPACACDFMPGWGNKKRQKSMALDGWMEGPSLRECGCVRGQLQ